MTTFYMFGSSSRPRNN